MHDIISPLINISQQQDFKDRVIYELESAINFFDFIDNSNYSMLYTSFLKMYNISNWREYVITIFGIFAISKYEIGIIKHNNISKDISKNVLESISLNYNDIVKYSADNRNDRKNNSDYREFRNKPLIKLGNGDYLVFHLEFLIDKLFNCLYFDFKSFNQVKININNLFTSEFSEKTLFNLYIKTCINTSICSALSEQQCKMQYNNSKDELGAPDYLLYNDDSIILFECKDIRINGEYIESHDYDKIQDEFRKKLYEKSSDNKKIKRVGITQLTGHMEFIRYGSCPYLKKVNKDISIYPILVISDYKLVGKGLNDILNEWYRKSIKELKIEHENNTPLIVISFLTLFKYNKLFKEKGFVFFFNEYIKHINAVENQCDTFDWYMSCNYKYDISDISNNIIKKLLL